jgi:hypothetical protein
MEKDREVLHAAGLLKAQVKRTSKGNYWMTIRVLRKALEITLMMKQKRLQIARQNGNELRYMQKQKHVCVSIRERVIC